MGRYLFLLSLSALLAPAAASAAEPAAAQVGVYAEHRNGNIVYHYEVSNRGAHALRGFRLGCDCARAPQAGQLRVLPAGAAPAAPGAQTGYPLPPDAVRAPAGWRARLHRGEGADGYWIDWYTPDPRIDAGVAPGTTLRGFSVELPRPDRAFLEGRVSFADAPAQRLRLLDLEPPRLRLRAQRAPGARASGAFRIVAHASDNRDPQPRVTLAAFAPAPGGHPAWIVTYAAVDASGNRTTASTRLPRSRPPEAPAPKAGRQQTVSGPGAGPLPASGLRPGAPGAGAPGPVPGPGRGPAASLLRLAVMP